MDTALYIYKLKTTTFKQKVPEAFTASKWQLNNPIFISCHFNFGKNLKKTHTKKHFPKGICQWICLIIEDHEYINIVEIKIGNFYSGWILGGKHFFSAPTKMLVYAN